MFGVVLPGRAVQTDFVQADPSGLKYTLTIHEDCGDSGNSSTSLSSISDIVFFLVNPAAFPNTHGAVLFAARQPVHDVATAPSFELLGAVHSERPSGIFRTKWNSGNENDGNAGTGAVVITLGVSVESRSHLQNLDVESQGVEDRVVHMARKIALNLFNFMQSFDDCNAKGGKMTVPVNVFERWIQRFKNRYKVDPNFFMKQDD